MNPTERPPMTINELHAELLRVGANFALAHDDEIARRLYEAAELTGEADALLTNILGRDGYPATRPE